jgi:hypothetical protein
MSLIKKIQIDRKFASDGLTGLDIPYSASQSINQAIDGVGASTSLNIINANTDRILDERGAWTIEGGASFDMPPVIDFYNGKFEPWIVNNVSGFQIVLNAFGADTFDTITGSANFVEINAGESATFYPLAPAIWGFSGALQEAQQLSVPEDFFEKVTSFSTALDTFDPVITKFTDPLDGDYVLEVSGVWQYSSLLRMMYFEVRVDGVQVLDATIEPKDIGAWDTFSLKTVIEAQVGAKTIDFRIRSQQVGDISEVRNVLMTLRKWEA